MNGDSLVWMLLAAALWRPLLLAAAVLVAIWLLRIRHPASQHVLWTTALAGMLLVVPASLWMPRWELAVLPAEPVSTPGVPLATPSAPPEPVDTAPYLPPANPTVATQSSAPTPPSHSAQASRSISMPSPASILMAIYFAGATLLLAYWSIGWVLLGRMRRRCRATGFRLLRESGDIAAPVTVGLLRKAVLLPENWRMWPRDMRHAVLAHEIAHIRRRDSWAMLLARATRIALWFHPLVWIAARRMQTLAELACDAVALHRTGDPGRYSEILLDFARQVNARQASMDRRARIAGLAMAATRGLSWRIDRIFRLADSEPRRLRHPILAAAALGVPMLCVAAGVQIGEKHVTPAATPPVFEPARAEPVSGPGESDVTFLLSQAQATPPALSPGDSPKTGVIEGAVSDARTGAPVEGAYVLFEPSDRYQRPLKTATGPGGRYRAEDLPPSDYTMSVHHPLYPRTYYQARANRTRGTLVSLRAGQTATHIDFDLEPFGVIAGRVLDDDGEPMPNVRVNAMTARYIAGRSTPELVEVPQGAGGTDDRGEYRMRVPPGSYYLRASMPMLARREVMEAAGRAAPPERPLKPGENYVATYYPGTYQPSAAVQVEIVPGRVMQGVSFVLTKTRTTTIRGRVINRTGGPSDRISVDYWPTGGSLQPILSVAADAQGRYEFPGVLPGHYSIRAQMTVSGESYWREETVDAGDDPAEAPDIVLEPGYFISGKVERENTDVAIENWSVALFPPGSFVFLPYPEGIIRADGSFDLSRANPDLLVVEVNNLPAGHYLKSARMGDMDILENGVDLRLGSPGPMTLVVSGRAAAVSGIVRNEDGRALDAATVVLMPTQVNRRNSRFWVRSTSTDTSGRFSLEGLHPGDYRLLAWEEIPTGAWRDPAVLRSAEPAAKRVDLHEGDTPTFELTALPPLP